MAPGRGLLFHVGRPRLQARLGIPESYGVARSSLGTPSRAPRDSNGEATPAAPTCSRNVDFTVPEVALRWFELEIHDTLDCREVSSVVGNHRRAYLPC